MTEKRFIPIFDGTDKRVVGAKDNGKIISFMDMFDLLNDLSDENEQLRKENDMLSCELSVSANKEISRNCRIAELEEENEQLKKELKRCRDWLNSDKNDYQLTLAFIKSKGYSLKDVLEYEKELQE